MITQIATKTRDISSGPAGHPSCGPDEKVREYYRSLLCRLPWPENSTSHRLRTVGITSCHRGEGVSTVASQLAATAACTSRNRVLLVDANPVSPSAERIFGLDRSAGLAEVLLKGDDVLSCIRATAVRNLSVLTAGGANGKSLQDCDPAGLAGMLESLKDNFDLAVFDIAAVVQSGFVVRLGPLLDGVLLVVEAERVRWEVARRATEELQRANVRLMGAVLNKRRQHVPQWLYRTL